MSAPYRIQTIAEQLGLSPDEWEPFGWYKAKFSPGVERNWLDRPSGRYIGVTAINPTPLGEGKTVVAIGLAMALCRLGKKAIATLRQPSLAPVFGIKGGGAGGGRATVEPATDVNLHLTGDLHAVSAAHNLLAALIDNHLARRKSPAIDPRTATWRRVIDVCDKGLTQIVTGLGGWPQAPVRETGFDLTAASEIMAILALTTGMADCRQRLGRIVVGATVDGDPVTANDLGAAGAMAALLNDALRPNLVQTCEGTPAIVHAGPFANIAHGNCSVLADQTAIRLADYVVTESGFGSDCGAEKLFDIKRLSSGLTPNVEVLVCTTRALKLHSGRFEVKPARPLPAELLQSQPEALKLGSVNLAAHIDILRRFGVPVVVAVNRFPEDDPGELAEVLAMAADFGAEDGAIVDVYGQGSEGGLDLAARVMRVADQPTAFRPLYSAEDSIEQKLATVATQVYGADGVDFTSTARRQIDACTRQGWSNLPVCVAKTQYSLSHDPQKVGRPTGFRLPIREIRLSAGAGFLYALAGDVSTMPGLPLEPAARRIEIADDGTIAGLK